VAKKVHGTPVQTAFDIETTGVGKPRFGSHFLQSSILEIGFASKGREGSLVADPASRRMSTWAYETVWKPLKEKRLAGAQRAHQTEQQILRKFLTHLQTLPDGSELIGWNIGYSPRVMGARDPLTLGYDLPGLATRGASYGMDKEIQEEVARLKVRDIGQEFAIKLSKGMHKEFGGRGVRELVKHGLLDSTAVSGNSLQLIDDFLNLRLTDDIDLSAAFKNLTDEQKAKITPSNTIEEAVRKIKEVSGLDDLSGGKETVEKKLRRQVFGYYHQILGAESFIGGDTQKLAKSMATQRFRLAGWAQETVQKSFMEFYGGDAKKNPLVRDYMVHLGSLGLDITEKEARDILSGKQAHLAKEDARIALGLANVIDNHMDEIFRDDKETLRFLGIWGRHSQKKKMFSSMVAHGFSWDVLNQLVNPEDGSTSLGGIFKDKAAFVDELAEVAKSEFGDARDWKAEILALKKGESLRSKFGLEGSTKRSLGDFVDWAVPTGKLNALGHLVGGLFEKGAGKLGGIGIGASILAAGVVKTLAPDIDLLSGISDPAEDFVKGVDPYWQHTLLGAPKISGKDDNFNTIEGIRHGGSAESMRRTLADFGSGWAPERGVAQQLSDPDFSLDPTIETRRRVESMRGKDKVSERDLFRFQRAYQYEHDVSLNQFLVDMSKGVPVSRFGLGGAITSIGESLMPPPGSQYSDSMYGVNIDPRVLAFRKNVLEDPDAYEDHRTEYKAAQRRGREQIGKFERSELFEDNLSDLKGISLHASNLRAVSLKDFNMEVEDADTLVLRRKGMMNVFDKPVYVRLAGIDAPEVGGHEHDPMAKWRINQEQPHGREATEVLKNLLAEQEDVSLLIDPSQTTYGRHVGMLAGDEGLNINLELLRLGAVSALPWGSRTGDIVDRTLAEEAETKAFEDDVGMWRHTRYKATREMGKILGTDITYNQYTDITKLAAKPDFAGWASYLEMGPTQYRPLSSQERSGIGKVGGNLRRLGFSGRRRPPWQSGYNKEGTTFGLRAREPASKSINYKLFTPDIPLTSNDDAYVNTEGLRHGGSAAAGRSKTDFGSGWKGAKNLKKKFVFGRTKSTYTNTSLRSFISDTPVSTHTKRGALEELSAEASAANRGIRQSHIATERVAQANNLPGGKRVHSEKTLAMKEFSEYTEPVRNRQHMQAPDFATKDSFSSKNHIDDEIRTLRREASVAAAKRRENFVRGAKEAPILRSVHARNAGNRSKRNSGGASNHPAGTLYRT